MLENAQTHIHRHLTLLRKDSCIELDSKMYTYHRITPSVLISSYFKPQTPFPYTHTQSILYDRVNPYVLFQSTHISNLGHGYMNILRFSPPSNFHLYNLSVLVDSRYLLIDQIPKQRIF